MPVIRSAEVEFGLGTFKTSKRRVLVGPETGSGAVTLGESILDPGAELVPHTHWIEETIVITEGEATAFLGDETHVLGPGDVLLSPAGVTHMLANRSKEPVRFYFFYPAVEVQSKRL